VLYVDSFGPRGEASICAQKLSERKIFDDNRRMDVAGALQWLARQPGVDARRLGVLGWSHGGSTVLAAADATNDAVRQQPVKPAALVAFYPGCGAYDLMLRYDAVAPLLVMTGELDNWTPAAPCERLTRRLTSRGQPVRYVQYPGSYHAFDGTSPVTERDNAGGTRFGKAMAGGNPEARTASAVEMLRFYAQYLGLNPVVESKVAEGHASAVPEPTQFAAVADVDRLPKVSEAGKALYREWLTKPFPRAVAISGKGAFARGYGAQAMETALRNCEKFGEPCHLYAVDDQVVWTGH
jgi:dienelactone hydrolase